MAKKESQPAVTVRLLQDPGKDAKLNAYVVDDNGNIVESAPFDGKEAKLTSDRIVVSGDSKVYIAQPIPKEIADLLKLKKEEEVKIVPKSQNELIIGVG